jgi:malate dehydrogenase
MSTWIHGTAPQNWTSMIVASDGSYGVEPGLMYSFPVEVKNGSWSIVQGLDIDAFSRLHMDISTSELLEEKAMVSHLILP